MVLPEPGGWRCLEPWRRLPDGSSNCRQKGFQVAAGAMEQAEALLEALPELEEAKKNNLALAPHFL